MSRRALILVGSPKPRRTTSGAIAAYLAAALEARGCETETLRARSVIADDAGRAAFLQAMNRADVFIPVFPLYYDGLPAIAMEALEGLLPGGIPDAGSRQVAAVVQCGFPEAEQNTAALNICRQFARETGMCWAGGLAIGMGGSLEGKALEQLGRRTRNLRRALDLGAEALAEGQPVPEEAAVLAARNMMPRWLYTFIGNWGWKHHARKRGTSKLLNSRPYPWPEE
jgi:hypothetical protein